MNPMLGSSVGDIRVQHAVPKGSDDIRQFSSACNFNETCVLVLAFSAPLAWQIAN